MGRSQPGKELGRKYRILMRENKYEACVAATVLACLGKTKEGIVAGQRGKRSGR